MPTKQNVCIYCGRNNVTKEHIYGKWSKKHSLSHFHNTPKMTHIIQNYRDLNPDFPMEQYKGALDRPGSNRSQTLKIACRECNGGWMKNNVDAAIPILTRLNYGKGIIQSEEFDVLAHWIAQFTMSYEFADRKSAMIPQYVRSDFARSSILRGYWVIALAFVSKISGKEPVFHKAMARLNKNAPADYMQATTFMFGKLIAFSFFSQIPTPPPIFLTLASMGLITIYPHPPLGVCQPNFLHDDESVFEVMDAVSESVRYWIEGGNSNRVFTIT